MSETYEAAGVSIQAGDEAVRRIGPLLKSTYRPEVLSSLGGFGGLFDVSNLGYDNPVLVSTTDGVGTKAVVASQMRIYDSIGLDLVAMWVDDLVCQGAQPLFFLDYVAPETCTGGDRAFGRRYRRRLLPKRLCAYRW